MGTVAGDAADGRSGDHRGTGGVLRGHRGYHTGIYRLKLVVVVVTLRASCGAVYCNRPCLCVCVCVSGSVTTITRNCVHRSSPNWVCIGKGSDHLQLRPGRGSAAGRNFLAPPYYSQRAVFASSPSVFLLLFFAGYTPKRISRKDFFAVEMAMIGFVFVSGSVMTRVRLCSGYSSVPYHSKYFKKYIVRFGAVALLATKREIFLRTRRPFQSAVKTLKALNNISPSSNSHWFSSYFFIIIFRRGCRVHPNVTHADSISRQRLTFKSPNYSLLITTRSLTELFDFQFQCKRV